MREKGLFIISLDFELMWGVRDKRSISSYGNNIKGVRQVIPGLLQLISDYNINATFATVGFLFARNKEELIKYIPSVLPDYNKKIYSPYENDYLQNIGNNELDDIYHYGSSLIKQIQQFPSQEIATHTFSHYYCLEGASLESFEADLIAAKQIAETYQIDLKSIIFPRNQYSDEHVSICKKLGFISFRGNEDSSVYNPRSNEEQNKFIRITRFADSYINVTGHHVFKEIMKDDIVNIPASRFLRPYNPKLTSFESLRLKRIKESMTFAAKENQIFHLWWHPHNFGIHINENFLFLEEVLKHFQLLHQQYGMQSKTMKATAEETLKVYAH
jgi:hypothetical protein